MATNDAPKRPNDLAHGVESLFGSQRFSDLTIRCGGREFKAHKAILCTQSDYFLAACDGNFREAAENVFNFEHDDPDVIEAMLQYIYKQDYTCNPVSLPSRGVLSFHVAVFGVAEKYMIGHLEECATRKFRQTVGSAWQTEDFANAIFEAYTNTQDRPSPLREVITRTVEQHMEALFHEPEYHFFQQATRDIPGFGVDLAKLMATAVKNAKSDLYAAQADAKAARNAAAGVRKPKHNSPPQTPPTYAFHGQENGSFPQYGGGAYPNRRAASPPGRSIYAQMRQQVDAAVQNSQTIYYNANHPAWYSGS